MAVLRESPWYQEILEEGTQLGLEKGLEKGLENALLQILQHRFGPVPEVVQQSIEACDLQELQALVNVALDAESLDAFVRQLPAAVAA